MYNEVGSIWAPVDAFIKKSPIQKVVSADLTLYPLLEVVHVAKRMAKILESWI